MKKNPTLYHFTNDDIKKDITDGHQSLLVQSKDLGKEHAQLNQPHIEASSKVYLGEIEQGYETLGRQVKTTLQSELQQKELDKKDDLFDQQITVCDQQLSALKNEMRIKKNELGKTDNSLIKKQKRWALARIAISVIVLCDIAISASAIQQMHYSLFVSILLGTTIGICILIISEHLRWIIDLGKTKIQKKIIVISLFTFLFFVFLTLGYFRSKGITTDDFTASPLYFALIQMLFLLTASVVAYIKKPSPQEYKKIDTYNISKDELRKTEKKQQLLLTNKHELQTEKKELEAAQRRLIQYHDDLLLEINAYWKIAYQAYCSTNLFTRADHQIPEFFNESARDLSFIITADSHSSL